jgi:hypothetical protein
MFHQLPHHRRKERLVARVEMSSQPQRVMLTSWSWD